MARPLQVGIQLPEVEWEVPFPELIDMARVAETVGFDSVWLGDHLIYDLAVGPRGPWEAWTSLSALAAATERVQLGPLVASTAFHAPAMLAKQAATVDAVSEGRLIVGLGAGWNAREFSAFGFAYDNRVSRFEEAFTIIRGLLATGHCDFVGRWYTVDDCHLHPRSPTPGGPPLMVGSVGPRMLRITLPHVDAWNVWWSDYGNTPDGFARRNAEVDAACHAVGRDPGEIERTAAVLVQLPGGAGRQMGGYTNEPATPVVGPPDEIADQLAAFAPAGADHLQLCVDPITRSTIEWLADVIAALDRKATA